VADLRLAFDLDDVVIDFTTGVLDSMYREFGVVIVKDEITTWDKNPMKLFPWHEYGYDHWFDWLKDRDWLWGLFPAIPGAIANIRAMRFDDGHYVECLTAKPVWAEPQVWKWLGRWRPAFQVVTIAGSGDSKAELSIADVLIDDRADNCFDWLDSDSERFAVLYDQPWNRDVRTGAPGQDRLVRASSMDEVREVVRQMEEVMS